MLTVSKQLVTSIKRMVPCYTKEKIKTLTKLKKIAAQFIKELI
jgi:hypothetical protein